MENRTNNIEERLSAEVAKRVAYYEENEPPMETHMSPIHYVIAVALAVIGLGMTILGAIIR